MSSGFFQWLAVYFISELWWVCYVPSSYWLLYVVSSVYPVFGKLFHCAVVVVSCPVYKVLLTPEFGMNSKLYKTSLSNMLKHPLRLY